MEHRRHSISTDKDAAITTYFDKHLKNWHDQGLLTEMQSPYRLLDQKEFSKHPVFSHRVRTAAE